MTRSDLREAAYLLGKAAAHLASDGATLTVTDVPDDTIAQLLVAGGELERADDGRHVVTYGGARLRIIAYGRHRAPAEVRP